MPETPVAPGDDAASLLRRWLGRQLSTTQAEWLDSHRAAAANGTLRDLQIASGLVPRRLGQASIALDAADLAAAGQARPGWNPHDLTVDAAARQLLVLDSVIEAGAALANLCASADVAEAVALYRGLPLYPPSDRLDQQIGEGLRTSMQPIFEAIAHRSPVPRERFDESRWNHMILKALFIGAALDPIQGLDARCNPDLATMLIHYARERRAAGRSVSPDLWRCVTPFAAQERNPAS